MFYRIYALIFNLFRIFPVKRNRVTFLSPHNGGENDNLHILAERLREKGGFDIRFVFSSREKMTLIKLFKFLFASPFFLATSGYVFLNDNFMPMAYMRFSQKAVITQLWHGQGAFKKFGLDTELEDSVKNLAEKGGAKLSFVICTSENVKKIYAGAFGVEESKVLPLGSPTAEYLLNSYESQNVSSVRERFDRMYPHLKNKKLVLYAPTFRDNSADDISLCSNIDKKMFSEVLGDEYAFLVKLHPQVHSSDIPSGMTDVTGESIFDLSLICECLITDYSSVCMDFAMLNKKCIFFAFDKEKYTAERSFYFDYDTYVPGEVTSDFETALKAVKVPFDIEKNRRFVEFNFDCINGSCDRILEKTIFGKS
ncbi:MAG: CDP-glycerol glycerophosphotransferase family protein [Clostridiales bacterium]|nr:CDP-glycerol glycerophosphotransferase family protein [Clostridiales bacterium]